MQLRYDEDLIEAAVFLCVSGQRKGVPSIQITRFHREREKLYRILDPDERSTAFFRLHLDWYREWGLEQPMFDTLDEFPALRGRLAVLAVRQTLTRNEEGAELFVDAEGQRTGLLALRVQRLTDDAGLRDYLRHEFMHLHDVLDPAFGYSPTLALPGLNAVQTRLAQERYRLVWGITIDSRLAAAGHAPLATREQHAAAFARGYSFWPEARRRSAFDSLWRNPAPCHADLLALIQDPRSLRETHRPAPGAWCPLCDFPTFAWAAAAALTPQLIARIAPDFPAWSPNQGLCSRCLEAYDALAQAPANVVT